MPTSLTDSPTFTSPVTAPADGDLATAASVQGAFQALANRTKYLLDKHLGPVTRTMRIPHVITGWLAPVYGGADPDLSALAPGLGTQGVLWLPRLPRDSVIRSLTIGCTPSDTRAGGARMAFTLMRTNNLGVTTTVYAGVYDNGSATAQQVVLPSPDSPHVYSDAHAYALVVVAGSTGVSGDAIHSVSVEFDDYTVTGSVSP